MAVVGNDICGHLLSRGFALRNLALFSFCFGLAAPLFWFNFLGTENLMLAGALILMLIFHLRGGLTRYVAALVLVGLLPLFKLTAGMVGIAALAGFLFERRSGADGKRSRRRPWLRWSRSR